SAPPALSTTGLHPGDVLTVAAQVDSAHAVTTSGAYSYSLHVWSTGFFDDTFTGYTFVDAQNSSPFGPGWTFSPVDQLVNLPASGSIPAGQLRLYGTGGWRFYQDLGGGAFLSPPGDNGTLTKNLSTGVFTYYTPEGLQYLFNSSGQMTSQVSADGQEVLSFGYTGSLVSSMTAIDGAASTFSYSSGLLSSIATPGPRTYSSTFTSGATTTLTA